VEPVFFFIETAPEYPVACGGELYYEIKSQKGNTDLFIF